MAFGGDVIASFSTGSYVVTRRAGAGASLDGHYTRPASTTLTIAASVQPISGRALRDLEEGRRADDMRVVYTTSELRTAQPGTDQPDVITIDGEAYRVVKVERFSVISDHYRATVERVPVP